MIPAVTLTGNARFRSTWNDRLVLQAEHRIAVDRAMGEPRKFWRDVAYHELATLRATRKANGMEPLI
jgi:hypothetical protein